MQTATATAPRSARETAQAEQFFDRSAVLDEYQPRFLVQMGWTSLNVDTAAAPNFRLLRGEITPCVSLAQRAALAEIPDGALIAGSEKQAVDRDGKEVWGAYRKPAYWEAQRLLDIEAASDWRAGLVEVQALSEMPRAYQRFDFNALFYPQGLENLPERNADLRAHLQQRLAEIEAAPQEFGLKTTPERELVLRVGAELVEAVTLADQLQRERLEHTHTCLKLPPSEEGHKRRYDAVDEEMQRRTGLPRLHDEQRQIATAVQTLAQRQTQQGDVQALLTAVQRLTQQNETLQTQLGEQARSQLELQAELKALKTARPTPLPPKSPAKTA